VAREASLWPERGPRRALAAMAASGLLSGLAAALLLTHHRLSAGLAALSSAAALLVGSIQARGEGGFSERLLGRAGLVERILDLGFDASILVPLAWVMRAGSNWDAVLAMVGFGAAYLASYERARGEALGYVGSESVGYRLTREALLVLGLLTGWIAASLWAFTSLTVAAAAVRAWNIVVQERHARAVEEATG
jgi:phosphatidylinositol phosphate synthase